MGVLGQSVARPRMVWAVGGEVQMHREQSHMTLQRMASRLLS